MDFMGPPFPDVAPNVVSGDPAGSGEEMPGFQEAPPSKARDCVGTGRAHSIPKGIATRPTGTKT